MNELAFEMINYFWPLLVLMGGGILVLFTSLLPTRRRVEISGYVTAAIFFATLLGYVYQFNHGLHRKVSLLLLDAYGNFLSIAIVFIGLVVTMLSISYFKRQQEAIGEVFSLLLFSTSGMCLMVQTTHWISFLIALEVMSLAIYVLVGINRGDAKSIEGALKYFVLGSAATAILLFGMALFYGGVNSFDFSRLSKTFIRPEMALYFKVSLLFIFIGFAFKVGSVPFHFWTPDVYTGAPYPITAFMATGVKVAAFGALLRVLLVLVPLHSELILKLFFGLCVATMIVGNIAALKQTNLKRLLAYSSIAHAGYLLLGCVAYITEVRSVGTGDVSPMVYYLVIYTLMTLGAFSILSTLARGSEEATELHDLAGLAKRKPLISAALAIFLISLAGIPPTAGFFGKFYLFKYALVMEHIPLVILAVLTSAVSFYYYMAPVVSMYFKSGDKVTISWINPISLGLVAVLAFIILYLGVRPSSYLYFSQMAIMAVF